MSQKIKKIKDKLEDLKCDLTEIADKKQAYYDGRSEAWKESDRAAEMEGEIEAIRDAAESCGDAAEYLEDYA